MKFRTGLLLAGLVMFPAFAASDLLQFDSVAQQQEYQQVVTSLRCPKCQNNSIADSDAMIASDMRKKVYQLLKQGDNKQQVIDYMVARYGHFVTYQPPLTVYTLILWAGPLLFILLAFAVIVRRSRKFNSAEWEQPDADAQQRLERLLDRDSEQS